MWDNNEATPWDMLVDCFDRMQELEKENAVVLATINNHSSILQQLLIQNDRLSQQNKLLTAEVAKLIE